MKRAAFALSLMAGLVIAGCGGSNSTQVTPDQTDATADLLVGTYVSGSNPQGQGIGFSSPVVVKIDRGEITWEARCNAYSARLEITAEQLITEGTAGTWVGCGGSARKQDQDLVEFFESNPNWQLDKSSLTLSNDDVEVGLSRDDHPPKYLDQDLYEQPGAETSEQCSGSNLTDCNPTSACLIKFGINPDDPDGWNQPHGWVACLKDQGASREVIRQYQPS